MARVAFEGLYLRLDLHLDNPVSAQARFVVVSLNYGLGSGKTVRPSGQCGAAGAIHRATACDLSRYLPHSEANPGRLGPKEREQLLLTQEARDRETTESLGQKRGASEPSV